MSNVNVKHIARCIEGAIFKTLEVQVSMQAKVAALSMTVQNLRSKDIDCLSTLALDSSALVGSLSLGFPKATLLKILEKMLGESFNEITAENSDAAGELLNIIYSSARKCINEADFDFGPSIPTTTFGQGLSLAKSNTSGTSLFFDCVSDAGVFVVILSLRKKAKVGSAA